MRSKYAFKPFSKLSWFDKGRSLIEQAVQKDPCCIEVRFLRLCVQSHAPSLLDYKGDIEADRQWICTKWAAAPDADLQQKLKKYMLRYGHCNRAQVALLNG